MRRFRPHRRPAPASLAVAFAALILALGALPPGAFAQTVSFWTQAATDPVVIDFVRAFEQESGITVDMRQISFELDELIVAHAAGASPDVFTHGAAALGGIAATGMMRSLDPYIERWPLASGVAPQAFESGTYQGRVVALPWRGFAIGALVYRVDMFAEAGLGEAPSNWEELAQYGRRLVQRGEDGRVTRAGLGIPTSGFNAAFWLRDLTQVNGIDVYNLAEPFALTDERIVEAATYFADLLFYHRVSDPNFGGNLVQGTTAMRWSRTGDLQTFMQMQDRADLLAIAPWPYNRKPAARVAGDWIAISASTTNDVRAWQLIEYMIDPARHSVMTEARGFVPIYREAAQWDWVLDRPEVGTLIEIMLERGWPDPPEAKFFDLRALYTDIMNEIIAQAMPPQVALEQGVGRFAAILRGE